MGRAFIIPNVNFGDTGLGKVNLTGNVPLRLFGIVAPDQITATQYQLKLQYAPLNTTQRAVQWSIVSGEQYASINPNTGVLNIVSGTVGKTVIVRASSVPTTYIAEKSIVVTYDGDDPIIYKIEKEYTSYLNPGDRVPIANTLVNENYIVLVTLGGTLQSGSHFRAFVQSKLTSPYQGFFAGSTLDGFGLYIIINDQPQKKYSLSGIYKFAIKKVDDNIKLTINGVDWVDIGNTDLSLADTFTYGQEFIGTLKLEFINDLNTDLSQYFQA